MKNKILNNKGITLVALIITVIVLLILASVATYSGIEAIENSKYTKFKSELKIMQTYINKWYEECKTTDDSQTFEDNINAKFTAPEIGATNAVGNTQSETTLNNAGIASNHAHYYLLQKDQKEALGIDNNGVTQDVLVSVIDRKVVSYLGMKYKDRMYYTLEDLGEYYNVEYKTPTTESPTFELEGFRQDDQKSAKISLKITYNAQYVNKGTIYYGIIKDGSTTATSYNSTNNDYFIITENGTYDIYVVDAAGNASSHVTKYFSKDANSPKLTDGMIPIKWNGTNWVVCDKDDIDWFSYDHKLWANIMLSDGTYKADTVQVGQVVAEADLGSMYVWIPRYAYKMPLNSYVYGTNANPEPHTIDVTFLNRNTNKAYNGKEFQKATANVDTMQTAIVHPAFTFGDKELEGIWVAKFEASGTTSGGQAVGNCSDTTLASRSDVQPDNTTIVKSLPNVISWRNMTIGNMQYYCMSIAGLKKANYGITSQDVNSHLIKNSEWGAAAYLSYSKYGEVPQINSAGSVTTGKSSNWYYNMYTGQGPKTGEKNENGTITTVDEGRYTADVSTHGYSTKNGILASTTGNITGVYDMNGGSWEYVAAYLDNTNYYLYYYGRTTAAISGSVINYFDTSTRELKPEYAELWDAYEVSEEERTNKIKVTIDNQNYEISQRGSTNATTGVTTDDRGNVVKTYLWNTQNNDLTFTQARYRLTKYIYDHLPKGIGVSEISDKFSFYNAYNNGTSNTWDWFRFTGIEDTPAFTRSATTSVWDSDYVLIGHASNPFVRRGGDCTSGTNAGVFSSGVSGGGGGHAIGFRSALVL